MRDSSFFSKLLKVEKPWRVDRVSLVTEPGQVDVYLEHRPGARFVCPECGLVLAAYDHVPSRSWRHLDHGEHVTWLHARLPRVFCLEHGVRRVEVPWALPDARFTTAFECHAIAVLREADVLGASRLLRISWHEAWNLMERAVRRGQQAKRKRVLRHLGVDEKAVAKRHQYVTLVCDLDRSTVEYIADDRKKTSLDAYYQSLTKKQLAGIQAVAMDMWDPFISSTLAHVPEKWEERFEKLRHLHLKTGRAWAIKEALRDLWSYQRKGWALRHWESWYYWATHSRLPAVVKAARTLAGHLDNVLTYFDHRITNATSEGLNSKIQTVKKTPAGFGTGTT